MASTKSDPQVSLEGKNARELHNSGGKCYAMEDYSSAVQYLSHACELGVKEYGDPLHDDMGEIYLMYGKSLLELTREEGDPLGENVPKDVVVGTEAAEDDEAEGGEDGVEKREGAEGEDDQEEDSEEDDDAEEGEESEEKDEKKEKGAESDKSVEDENAKNEKREETEKDVEGAASGVEFNGEKGDEKVNNEDIEASKGENEDAEADKEQEPSDLQVGWEILELAKAIFTKRGESGKLYLADTLITLGEISMETDNAELAIADIQEAVEILKTLQDENSRVLAEAYYKLGMVHAMDNKIDEAVQHYGKSKEILENRIKSLESSERVLHKKEVQDMQKVLPEIDEKVADLKSFQAEQLKKAAEDPRPILPGSPDKKAGDISHLVKRKRKSDDEESAGPSNPLPKKPSLE